MIWIPSGVSNVPTPLSGVAIRMLFARRLKDHFQIESQAHNFLFGTTTTPSFTFSTSHFFSGQSRHAFSSLIVLYLWLGARRPTPEYDTSINQTAESYHMRKVKKGAQNTVRDKAG
jgi:hypothetical protein